MQQKKNRKWPTKQTPRGLRTCSCPVHCFLLQFVLARIGTTFSHTQCNHTKVEENQRTKRIQDRWLVHEFHQSSCQQASTGLWTLTETCSPSVCSRDLLDPSSCFRLPNRFKCSFAVAVGVFDNTLCQVMQLNFGFWTKIDVKLHLKTHFPSVFCGFNKNGTRDNVRVLYSADVPRKTLVKKTLGIFEQKQPVGAPDGTAKMACKPKAGAAFANRLNRHCCLWQSADRCRKSVRDSHVGRMHNTFVYTAQWAPSVQILGHRLSKVNCWVTNQNMEWQKYLKLTLRLRLSHNDESNAQYHEKKWCFFLQRTQAMWFFEQPKPFVRKSLPVCFWAGKNMARQVETVATSPDGLVALRLERTQSWSHPF